MASQIPLSSQLEAFNKPNPNPTVFLMDSGSVNMSNHPSIQKVMETNEELKKKAVAASKIPKAKSLKEQAKFLREVEAAHENTEVGFKERQKLADKLNRYKQTYEGAIEFKFRQSGYSADLSKTYLESQYQAVRLELDTEDIAERVKSTLNYVVFVGSKIVRVVDPRFAMLADKFKDKVSDESEKGTYDKELLQISVELAELFAVGPYARLLGKLGKTASETIDETLNGVTPELKIPSDEELIKLKEAQAKISEEMRKVKDKSKGL